MESLTGIIIAVAVVFFTIVVVIFLVMTCIFWYGILRPEGVHDYHVGHSSDQTSEFKPVAENARFSPNREISKFDLETEGLVTASDSSLSENSSRLALVKRMSGDDDPLIAEAITKPERKYLKSQLATFRKTLVLQAMIENSINPKSGTVTCIKDIHSSEKITIGSIVIVKRQFEVNGSNMLKIGDLLQVLRFYIKDFPDGMPLGTAYTEKGNQENLVWCTGILLRSYILQAKQDLCFRSRQESASGKSLLREVPLIYVSVETEIQAMMATRDSLDVKLTPVV